MKKFLKILLWVSLTLILLVVAAGGLFFYKVTNGFPVTYETKKPELNIQASTTAVLLFSKSTGFRHGESIEAGKKRFAELSKTNNWQLYSTEEGGVFNPDQLAKFDAVVFNNCTGRLLNVSQQNALEEYVQNGGKWIGIHGAGDNSHHWPWYEKNLVGANFSHHSIKPHLQNAEVKLNTVTDSILVKNLPSSWSHTDEWYVFFENPRANGFNVIYNIDGQTIEPNGNILWQKDKNFGMGKDHPVAWYKSIGKGRSFYTSMGHDSTVWHQPVFLKMLENAVMY